METYDVDGKSLTDAWTSNWAVVETVNVNVVDRVFYLQLVVNVVALEWVVFETYDVDGESVTDAWTSMQLY